MNALTYKRKIFEINKKIISDIIIMLIFLYFVLHSIYGSRGIIAYFKLQSELAQAHEKLRNLNAKRLDVESDTKLLRPDSLDRDMLDEKIRNVLGLSLSNEEIFRAKKDYLSNKEVNY